MFKLLIKIDKTADFPYIADLYYRPEWTASPPAWRRINHLTCSTILGARFWAWRRKRRYLKRLDYSNETQKEYYFA